MVKAKLRIKVRPMRGGYQIRSNDVPGLDILVTDRKDVEDSIRQAVQRSMKRHHDVSVEPMVSCPVLSLDMDETEALVMLRTPLRAINKASKNDPPPDLTA